MYMYVKYLWIVSLLSFPGTVHCTQTFVFTNINELELSATCCTGLTYLILVCVRCGQGTGAGSSAPKK